MVKKTLNLFYLFRTVEVASDLHFGYLGKKHKFPNYCMNVLRTSTIAVKSLLGPICPTVIYRSNTLNSKDRVSIT